MTRVLCFLTVAVALLLAVPVLGPSTGEAQGPPAKKAAATPKVGKDEKLCRVRFPDGEVKAWVCKKDAACCSWDDAKYVRCGTITGCLIGTAPIR